MNIPCLAETYFDIVLFDSWQLLFPTMLKKVQPHDHRMLSQNDHASLAEIRSISSLISTDCQVVDDDAEIVCVI
jgi:hypothetical protein